jgi:hypothetical protein
VQGPAPSVSEGEGGAGGERWEVERCGEEEEERAIGGGRGCRDWASGEKAARVFTGSFYIPAQSKYRLLRCKVRSILRLENGRRGGCAVRPPMGGIYYRLDAMSLLS